MKKAEQAEQKAWSKVTGGQEKKRGTLREL